MLISSWHGLPRHNSFQAIPLPWVEVDLKCKLPPFIYVFTVSGNLGCFIVGFMSEIPLDPPSKFLEILI